MSWLFRTLRVPATESHMGFALALCAFAMGLMSLAIVWQAQVIAYQRDLIKWLETLKFAG